MPLGQYRPEMVYAHGTVQAWTVICPWGRIGLDWSTPLGQDRPGLVYSPVAGQARTGLCPWGKTGLK